MSDVTAAPASTDAGNTPDAPAEASAPVSSGKVPVPSVPAGAEKLMGRDASGKFTPGEKKADAPQPTEEKKAAEKRKYKLKVDGGEEELELSDEEIAVRLQKERAAGKRMQEAAELRKKFQQAVDLIKKDPFAALKDPVFGVDLDALAEKRIVEKYSRDMMPPEERQKLEMQEKLAAYEAEKAESVRAQEEAAHQAQAHRVYQETERSLLDALGQEGMTKDYETLLEMVEIAKLNLDYGIELTPAQMAAEVKARRGERTSKAFGTLKGLKGDELVSRLGEDVVNEVLRHSVARLKGTSAAPLAAKPALKPVQAPGQVDDEGKPRKSLSPAQWRREIGLK
jgi:hypothetical protein